MYTTPIMWLFTFAKKDGIKLFKKLPQFLNYERQKFQLQSFLQFLML